eukprot:6167805-Prymnesium_polylepis.1
MPSPFVPLAPSADTLFGVLDALGTQKITVRGRTLRHVPYTCVLRQLCALCGAKGQRVASSLSCDNSALFVARKGRFFSDVGTVTRSMLSKQLKGGVTA